MPNVQTEKIELESLLATAQIPALPQTAIRLLELSQDASNGPSEFVVPIEADAGLLSQVLKFVNSSYFGFTREIGSVKQALALVGVRTIKNFALWSAVFSLVPDPKFGPFDLKKLWQDSLRRAVFARIVGKHIKLSNSEDLFSAALLQDMAIPLLLKQLPQQYESLIERRVTEQVRLSHLEQECFGWDHAQAAAALVRSWQLPEEFAQLIERHPRLDELFSAGPGSRDAVCVALGALLPSCHDSDWIDREEFVGGFQQLANCSEAELIEILTETDRSFETFAPVMKLPSTDRSLVDWFNN